MGEHEVRTMEGDSRRAFMKCLLRDLRALEIMAREGQIESGVRRIGAEQELFLVDQSWRPAPAALDLIERLDDEHFTNELALFNVELNVDPFVFGEDALHRIETQLRELLGRAEDAAAEMGIHCVLAGILPTLRQSDLDLRNMTPRQRYRELNRALAEMRGGAPFDFRIKGVDELILKHDSVMVEACNCSFQVHFQVDADEFPRLYNIAQAVAGPVLALATNSPLLFGRRLWRETRIATFQQSVDTRSTSDHLRELSPRVSFGRSWVKDSVVELFREDIARFRVIFGTECEEDSLEVLEQGGVPSLKALRLHNGTVYRWNRACYGVTEGKPHLRIENRLFPSGPTILDEVANAAFWFGLISALSEEHRDITKVMDFEDATANFQAAARNGLHAQFDWLGKARPAERLVADELLPLARQGLVERGIRGEDIERYLGVVEERVESMQTGSQWLISSLSSMRDHGTAGERLNALTAASVARQKTCEPVHTWEPARLEEAGGWQHNYIKVEQFMTTDMFTVHEDESIDLVASLMDWQRIRHVPVEDSQHKLVGVVSYRALLRHLASGGEVDGKEHVAVSQLMHENPLTVSPDTRTLEAIELMRKSKVGCLPVVKEGHLVGVVVERDFMDIAAELLAERLREADEE